MATQYERVLIQHMMVPQSLHVIVDMDLPAEIFPSEMLRPLYNWIIDYWHADAHQYPPSVEAVNVHFANVLAEAEIDITIEPEDSLVWAIEAIRGAYIDSQWQPWVKDFAVKIMGADLLAKASLLDSAIEELMAIQATFIRRSEQVDVRVGAQSHYEQYEQRAASTGDTSVVGARFGIRAGHDFAGTPIDIHTGGIRPSEIAVLAAPPKTGKSFALLWGAYESWRVGGTPVLFTLENSVEMTLDRLSCMVNSVDTRNWDEGRCTEEEVMRVRGWLEWLKAQERPLHVVQPEPGKRNVESLIRRARSLGDSIWIDQLTFVEVNKGDERRPRTEQIRAIMHDAKAMISTGVRVPLIFAHQINREGVNFARKTGYLMMDHLAESAEIERTADYVFGLWQSNALRQVGRAWFQTLAARRKDLLHWEIEWRPHIGRISIRNEVILPEAV